MVHAQFRDGMEDINARPPEIFGEQWLARNYPKNQNKIYTKRGPADAAGPHLPFSSRVRYFPGQSAPNQ